MCPKKSKAEESDLSELITQAEAARLRHVSRSAISDLVKRNKLRSIEIAGRSLVFRSEVLSYEPEIGGRPRKQKN